MGSARGPSDPPRSGLPADLAGRAAALVVAHPGHELRLHGWLSHAHPEVHVLTDGSGSTGASRLASTRHVLAETGATPGAVYGALTDAALYAAVLDGDAGRFAALVDSLARSLHAARTSYVVFDAAEGCNPAHDLCGVVVAAATALAARRGAAAPEAYEYTVVGLADEGLGPLRAGSVRLDLDEDAFRRKCAAGAAYPGLQAEVEIALLGAGVDVHRTEVLRPVDPGAEPGAPPEDPPFYELYGERRVAEGRYRRVLRWKEHLRPFAREVLRRAAEAPA